MIEMLAKPRSQGDTKTHNPNPSSIQFAITFVFYHTCQDEQEPAHRVWLRARGPRRAELGARVLPSRIWIPAGVYPDEGRAGTTMLQHGRLSIERLRAFAVTVTAQELPDPRRIRLERKFFDSLSALGTGPSSRTTIRIAGLVHDSFALRLIVIRHIN